MQDKSTIGYGFQFYVRDYFIGFVCTCGYSLDLQDDHQCMWSRGFWPQNPHEAA